MGAVCGEGFRIDIEIMSTIAIYSHQYFSSRLQCPAARIRAGGRAAVWPTTPRWTRLATLPGPSTTSGSEARCAVVQFEDYDRRSTQSQHLNENGFCVAEREAADGLHFRRV